MKVILAKQAGFCFGVKRATQIAFEAAGKDQKTYTLGPIIGTDKIASVKIVWLVPASAGNDIQGDSVTIDTEFGVNQI